MWQAVKNKVKAWKDARKEEKVCEKGSKTPVTIRNVERFVDRQNVETAMNPREHGDTARTAKWISDASTS